MLIDDASQYVYHSFPFGEQVFHTVIVLIEQVLQNALYCISEVIAMDNGIDCDRWFQVVIPLGLSRQSVLGVADMLLIEDNNEKNNAVPRTNSSALLTHCKLSPYSIGTVMQGKVQCGEPLCKDSITRNSRTILILAFASSSIE